IYTVVVFFAWLGGVYALLQLIMLGIANLVCGISLLLTVQGKWRVGSYTLIISFLVIGCTGTWQGGLNTPYILAIAIAIMISSILNNTYAAVTVMAAGMILYLLIGFRVDVSPLNEKLRYAFTAVGLLGTFTVLQAFSRTQIRKTLAAIQLHRDILTADLRERQRMEDELKYLSSHDALTGLYNRAFFQSKLDEMQAGNHYPLSIIMSDMDGLKTINDSKGHSAGDEQIRRAAEALKQVFRPQDSIARLGGDEFAILMPDTDGHTGDELVAAARTHIESVNRAAPELPPIRISFGRATSEQCCNLVEVFKEADDRMYANKKDRKRTSADVDFLT
ncbi:MAG: GGDEF domain-containing protein, partial [Anaerolineaceae bacterium]|nr:GGDEF domain-containing protein [Anaerolineaceae bacterium]